VGLLLCGPPNILVLLLLSNTFEAFELDCSLDYWFDKNLAAYALLFLLAAIALGKSKKVCCWLEPPNIAVPAACICRFTKLFVDAL